MFVKEQIMQFLYASLVPFHYRFASFLFMPVPPRSAVASIVLKITRQIFVFFVELRSLEWGTGRARARARGRGRGRAEPSPPSVQRWFIFHIYDLVNNHPLSSPFPAIFNGTSTSIYAAQCYFHNLLCFPNTFRTNCSYFSSSSSITLHFHPYVVERFSRKRRSDARWLFFIIVKVRGRYSPREREKLTISLRKTG